ALAGQDRGRQAQAAVARRLREPRLRRPAIHPGSTEERCMSTYFCFVLFACEVLCCQAESPRTDTRLEAEYYVAAYAQHHGVPITFARAIVEQESGWHSCAISHKGAVGLMQLMPSTAARLGVRDRCNLNENVSGGILHLAWLM